MRDLIAVSVSSIALSSGAAAANGRSQAVEAADSRAIEWNIPAQSLASALIAWSERADYVVLVQDGLASGVQTEPLVGSFTKFEALDRLLNASGLTYKIKDKQTLVVKMRVQTASATVPSEQVGGVREPDPRLIRIAQSDANPRQDHGDDSDDHNSRDKDKIVVTGTRIRGVSPAAPIRTITRQDIERSGQSQTGALLRTLPEVFSGGINPTVQPNTIAANSGIASDSTINLRGMGPDATLVLIDGQRLAPISGGETVDISVIPLAAIKRVDVLLDGSSALYGADAVAGVVNFVMADDYDGAEFRAHAGGATQGGGFEQGYSAAAGRSWGGGSLMAGADYQKQEPIFASDRDFSDTAGPLNSLLAGHEQWSTFLVGRQDVTDSVTLHMVGLYTQRQTSRTTEFSPGGFADTNETDTTTIFLSPRATIALPADWNMNVRGSFTRSVRDGDDHDNFGGGLISRSQNDAWSVETTFEGALLRLPSGDIRTALGGGYRRERLIEDLGGTPRNGRRNIEFLFGEMSAPLLSPSDTRIGANSLDLDLAVRVEDHTGFGTATTPKVGLRYVPLSGLTLRSTWGKSFRAPRFDHLLAENVVTLWDATALGSAAPGLAILNFGGDPNINPERANSWTAGFDWTPAFASSVNISATYFNIDFKDRIVSPIANIGSALSDPANAPFIAPNPTPAEQAAVINGADRFFNVSGLPYDPTQVLAIVNSGFVNASTQKVLGADFSINYRTGDFSFFGNVSKLQIDQNTIQTLPLTRQSGFIFLPAKLRMRSGASWEHNGFSATTIVNYISGSIDNVIVPAGKVGAWTTLDVTLQYDLG
ncbi:MAG TPA: TonB-dependent receptor, partial [Parvularculaceae bacterium]|nr:TonB-dependent receptor [Parvularculaceae bacterium]